MKALHATSTDLFLTAAAACFALAALGRYLRRPQLPPGPQGYPIVGNIFNMPFKNEWIVYAGWAKKYGDIFSLRALGQVMIVLDSAHDVRELLVKRSSQFSDRVHLTMPIISGWGNTVALLTPDKFRIVKRFITKYFGQKVIPRIVDVADKEITGYLRRIIRTPGTVDPSAQVKRLVGGTVLRFAYGYRVQSDNDPFVALSETALATFLLSNAPGWAVDTFPWLQYLPSWLPGMGFKRTAKRWHKISDESHSALLDWTKRQLAAGTAEPSLAADLLADPDTPENDKLFFFALGDLYIAGTDTTSSVCLTLMLNLALHPDIQAKAQRELDSVTLGERLPSYSDRPSLPYVNALVKEAYRFGTIVPLALPHRVSETTDYKGFCFPENAVIIPNVWSILHNPNKYPDPFKFNPERFLTGEFHSSSLSVDDEVVNEDPTKYIFGFGSRQCPGRVVADATVFLFAAKILAACTISQAVNEHGDPIPPRDIKYVSAFVSRPEPFMCTIHPKPGSEKIFSDGIPV